jgi:hypothetical protein
MKRKNSPGCTCCGECCMQPEDMPWTKFVLKNTLAGCTTGGGYSPPEAEFLKIGCCYQASMNVDCSSEYLCQVYAKQTATVSMTLDFYRAKIPYVFPGDTAECQCILTQRHEGERTITAESRFFHRRKLTRIDVTVGKTNYDCGTGSPVCKYYIAINYWYDTSEFMTDLCLPAYSQSTISCTGLYRDGTCSYTNTFDSSFGSEDCNDLLADGNFDAVGTPGLLIIGRVKYYDSLPTGDVTITNSDVASECSFPNCETANDPSCFPAFPEYDGPSPRFFALATSACSCFVGCIPYTDIFETPNLEACYIEEECPTVVHGAAVTYTVPIFDCTTVDGNTCCVANGNTCEVSGSEADKFSGCYYIRNKITGEVLFEPLRSYTDIIPGMNFCPPPEDPVSAGCFNESVNSNCDGTNKCKDCRTLPCTYVFCPDLSGSVETIDRFKYCKEEVTDFSCEIGPLEKFTAGNFCVTTPSTTLGFA